MINRIENLNAINPSAVETDSESLWQHIWAVFYSITVTHMQRGSRCGRDRQQKQLVKKEHTKKRIAPPLVQKRWNT